MYEYRVELQVARRNMARTIGEHESDSDLRIDVHSTSLAGAFAELRSPRAFNANECLEVAPGSCSLPEQWPDSTLNKVSRPPIRGGHHRCPASHPDRVLSADGSPPEAAAAATRTVNRPPATTQTNDRDGRSSTTGVPASATSVPASQTGTTPHTPPQTSQSTTSTPEPTAEPSKTAGQSSAAASTPNSAPDTPQGDTPGG